MTFVSYHTVQTFFTSACRGASTRGRFRVLAKARALFSPIYEIGLLSFSVVWPGACVTWFIQFRTACFLSGLAPGDFR